MNLKSPLLIISLHIAFTNFLHLCVFGIQADGPTHAHAHPPLLHPPDKQAPHSTIDPAESHPAELNSTPISIFHHLPPHSGASLSTTSLLRWSIAAYALNFFLISVGVVFFMLTVDESHLAVEGWGRDMVGLDADGLTLRDRRLEEGGGESDLDTSSFGGSYYARDGDGSDTEVEYEEEFIMPVDMQVKRWTSGVSDFMF